MTILSNTTWASWFVALVVIYYVVLWCFSFSWRPLAIESSNFHPFVVILVPALNEQEVIRKSLSDLLQINYDDFMIILMNDASEDDTSAIARSLGEHTQKLMVVDRRMPMARSGKSSVLNHGLSLVNEMLVEDPSRFGGRDRSEVLIGIVDADGSLDKDTLRIIAPYFADSDIGQLQIGVKIANADANLLTRLQDMEFVGFSSFVQVARDRIGSSGLGGNGQFTRLSALAEIGPEPWTPTALTEDLDLGLALVGLGWGTRFTNQCFVHQQGLTKWRPLLRQRTRWIQGHYQCWKYIPQLFKSDKVKLATKIDLTAYLLLVTTVVVVSYLLVTGLLTLFNVHAFQNTFLDFVPDGYPRRLVNGFLMLAPIVAFLHTYQVHSDFKLRVWEIPAFGFVFTMYSYVWVIASFRAWSRMVFRRNEWVKTPRIPATTSK